MTMDGVIVEAALLELRNSSGIQESLISALGNMTSNDSSETDVFCTHFSKAPSRPWSEVLEGGLSMVVGIFGLLGNISAIAVLRKDDFKETFHKLLICLCTFDSMFLVCALFIYTFRAHRLYIINSAIINGLFTVFYPFGNVCLYGSIYSTIAISFERYLGITSPLRSRTEPKRKLIKYLFPVLFLSLGFNIPKMFEMTLTGSQDTWLSQNIEYTHYYKVWSDLILTTILPLAALLFFNGNILLAIRRSRNMQSSSSSFSSNNRLKQEFALSMVLIGIVLVFFLCHVFRFFLAFYRVSVTRRTITCLLEKGLNAKQPEWLYTVTAISHFMLTVNSSVNFLVYCVFGTRFRKALHLKELRKCLGSLCPRKGNSTSSSNDLRSVSHEHDMEKSEGDDEETILEMVHIGKRKRSSRFQSFKPVLCISSSDSFRRHRNKRKQPRRTGRLDQSRAINIIAHSSNTVEITDL